MGILQKVGHIDILSTIQTDTLKLGDHVVASSISYQPSFAAIHFVACSIRAMALRCLPCSVARFERCFCFLGGVVFKSFISEEFISNQGISEFVFAFFYHFLVVGSIWNKEPWPPKRKGWIHVFFRCGVCVGVSHLEAVILRSSLASPRCHCEQHWCPAHVENTTLPVLLLCGRWTRQVFVDGFSGSGSSNLKWWIVMRLVNHAAIFSSMCTEWKWKKNVEPRILNRRSSVTNALRSWHSKDVSLNTWPLHPPRWRNPSHHDLGKIPKKMMPRGGHRNTTTCCSQKKKTRLETWNSWNLIFNKFYLGSSPPYVTKWQKICRFWDSEIPMPLKASRWLAILTPQPQWVFSLFSGFLSPRFFQKKEVVWFGCFQNRVTPKWMLYNGKPY